MALTEGKLKKKPKDDLTRPMDDLEIKEFFEGLAEKGLHIMHKCKQDGEEMQVDIYEVCTECEFYKGMHKIKGMEKKQPHRGVFVECHLPRYIIGTTMRLNLGK